MRCKACADAEREPTRDEFHRGCMSCEARALASLGAHVESLERRCITPQYRAALEALFGEAWMQGHEHVKRWAGKITSAAARRKEKAT
ncbi:hypothetical protein [Piscinibacter defluvii]|uniref:hypothetical protein n=1 Tax=Piscinibacter defluvii TaxID=1796922 RepID=UPI000FDD6CC4|nr:hypothetical protein [Piscinibacter defluvii]